MKLSTGLAFKNLRKGGLLVTLNEEEVDRLHDVLRETLFDVASFCEQNNITYYLSSGTLLGAVRNQGFIPWDDDIDIEMPRKDFDLFVKTFPARFREKYSVQIPGETPNYYLGIGRVRRNGTIVRDQNDFGNASAGAFIDIFVIENAPNAAPLRVLHGVGSLALGFAASCRRFFLFENEYRAICENTPEAQKAFLLKIAIGKVLAFRSAEAWAGSWNKWNSIVKRETRYVVMPTAIRHYFKTIWPRSYYLPPRKVLFEGREMLVPREVETLLADCYGDDYLTPVEEGHRDSHAFVEFDLSGVETEISPRIR